MLIERRRVVWIVVVVGAVALAGCPRKGAAPVLKEVIRPVVTMAAPQPGSGRKRTFSGTAKAAVETPLSFRVGGEICELSAKLGTRVEANDLIARLDPRDHVLQVEQNKADLAKAEAQLEQAKAEYGRVRQLYEARHVSKSSLDSQMASYKSAVAQREAAAKGLELAKQQLDYCTLRAPVSGAVASVAAEAHQTVSAGRTVATITSGDGIEMEVGMPEALISQVRVGDSTTVTFDALPGARFPARVSEVGIELGASSTYVVKLVLLEKSPRIRLGMVGEATFSFKAAPGSEAIVVPQVAVVPTPDGERYVWTYQADSQTVARRIVKVGALTSDGLQILAGLKPGEIFVTRGVHRLTQGMKVRLLDE